MRTSVLVVVMCGLLLAGCEKQQAAKPQQVSVYMYSEYIDPEMPKEFEKLTGTKVRIDVYENTEEMMAKLQQGGGVSQYDVIVISDVAIPALVKLGLVQPLDMSKIPNAGNVDSKFRNAPYDPQSKYSLPYQWGTVGLMYAKDRMPAGPISWSVLFDPAKQPGRFVLMDSMRDMIGIALKHQGKSMNSRNPQEIKAAGDLILKAKKSPNALGFEGGVGGKNRVVAGEAAMAVVYNGDAARAIAENDKLAYVVPTEGGVLWVDVMMVTSKAPNREAAHQFINYILDPKVGAQLSNFNRYATPNAASLPMIRAEDRQNIAIYPTEDVTKSLEFLQDVDNDTRLYDEVWTTIKAQ